MKSLWIIALAIFVGLSFTLFIQCENICALSPYRSGDPSSAPDFTHSNEMMEAPAHAQHAACHSKLQHSQPEENNPANHSNHHCLVFFHPQSKARLSISGSGSLISVDKAPVASSDFLLSPERFDHSPPGLAKNFTPTPLLSLRI
jgi:hypothetical protein